MRKIKAIQDSSRNVMALVNYFFLARTYLIVFLFLILCSTFQIIPTPNAYAGKQRDVNVNFKEEEGRTPLIIAAREGQVEEILRLIKAEANVNATDNNGGTALMYASLNGYVEAAKILIENGAILNTQDRGGQTALIAACGSLRHASGCLEVVKLLLDNGADPNIQAGTNKRTALTMVADSGKWYQQGMIHQDPWRKEIVVELLKKGVNVNYQEEDGITALIYASICGLEQVVKVLLQHGADPNLSHKTGLTPLMSAAGQGHDTLVKLLIDKKVLINKQDDRGWSALIYAARNNKAIGCVEMLLAAGADRNIKDKDGHTAQWHAENKGNEGIATLLRNP